MYGKYNHGRKLRFLSTLMALVMVITCVPVQCFGIVSAQESVSTDAYIVSEVEDLRDKYSKTFLKSDGTYVAISTGNALHKWDDETEQWFDIDNTLTQSGGAYTNAESNLNVSLPVSLTPESEVKVESDGYEISMRLDNAKNALGRADNQNARHKIKAKKLEQSTTEDIV